MLYTPAGAGPANASGLRPPPLPTETPVTHAPGERQGSAYGKTASWVGATEDEIATTDAGLISQIADSCKTDTHGTVIPKQEVRQWLEDALEEQRGDA